jgi:hypothetical protein
MTLSRKLFWLWLLGAIFWIGLEFLDYWVWGRCLAVPTRPLCQLFTTDIRALLAYTLGPPVVVFVLGYGLLRLFTRYRR